MVDHDDHINPGADDNEYKSTLPPPPVPPTTGRRSNHDGATPIPVADPLPGIFDEVDTIPGDTGSAGNDIADPESPEKNEKNKRSHPDDEPETDAGLDARIRKAMRNPLVELGLVPLEEWNLPGIIGDLVRKIMPCTEASAITVFMVILAVAATLIGPGPCVMVGADKHTAKFFMLILGPSSKARKGTAGRIGRWVMEQLDPWASVHRITSGINSGEALDDLFSHDLPQPPAGSIIHPMAVLVMEEEFDRYLAAARRETSTLSAKTRLLYDNSPISHRVKGHVTEIPVHHFVFIAMATTAELRARGLAQNIKSGLLNRMTLVTSRRSKLLPNAPSIEEADCGTELADLEKRIRKAQEVRQVTFTDRGRVRWEKVYTVIETFEPGPLSSELLARAGAMVLDYALILALVDGRDAIDVHHIDQAVQIWMLSVECAANLANETSATSLLTRIIAVLRQDPEGVSKTQFQEYMGHHDVTERRKILDFLEEAGLVEVDEVGVGRGRPATVYRWVGPSTDEGMSQEGDQ